MGQKENKTTRPAFIMFRRNSFLFGQLIQKRPTAFVLLSIIAQRARFAPDSKVGVKGLSLGEALIGDHKTYGVSARQYRTDKEKLKEYGLATFRKTNRGTVALLLTTDIFDINTSDERQTERPSGRQANDKPSDIKTTSKEEYKEYKEGKEVSPASQSSQGIVVSGKEKRKSVKFPKDWYDSIIEEYQSLKGITLQGSEFKPIQQTIKSMFMDGRTREQVIETMRWVAEQDWDDWTLWTVKKKLPEVLPRLGIAENSTPQSPQDQELLRKTQEAERRAGQ